MLGLVAIPLIAVGLIALAGLGDDEPIEENLDTDAPVDDMPDLPVDEGPDISRTPEELVTAVDSEGNEIPDSEIIGPERISDEGDRLPFVVDGRTDVEAIDIGYDREVDFEVIPGADTATIDIHLNSDVSAGAFERVDVQTEGTGQLWEGGPLDSPYTLNQSHLEFDSNAQINVHVDQDEIGLVKTDPVIYGDLVFGPHEETTSIDLRNPESAVHFEFADNVIGDLHLVETVEGGGNGWTNSFESTYLYVIQTPSGFFEDLTGYEIWQTMEGIIANESAIGSDVGSRPEGTVVIANIYAGEYNYDVTRFQNGEPNTHNVENFLNANPTITTNIPWASLVQLS